MMDFGWRCVYAGTSSLTNVPSGGDEASEGGYACVRVLNFAVNLELF